MDNIKITSGTYRGRIIKSPHSKKTHPMGAREKLALFNMINDYLPDAVVLDAFAGSGALGIEAISRGANKAIFVEKDTAAYRTIKENLKTLDLKSEVYQTDVVKFTTDEKFNIIIADPPYDNFQISDVMHLSQFLKGDGVLVLSHPDDTPELSGMICAKTRQYASAHISVYIKE